VVAAKDVGAVAKKANVLFNKAATRLAISNVTSD
jgi:hypothetical protein